MGKISFAPAAGFILVKPTERQNASGIEIADSTEEESRQGEVVAVGDGTIHQSGTHIGAPVGVGQKIVYRSYEPLFLDGIKYLIVSFESIRGILYEGKK